MKKKTFIALLATFLIMPLGMALANGSNGKQDKTDKPHFNMGFFKKEWKEKNKKMIENWKKNRENKKNFKKTAKTLRRALTHASNAMRTIEKCMRKCSKT